MSKEALKKVAIGAAIAGGGAALTYVIEAVPTLDLGMWAPLVTAACAVGINALRKWGK